MYKHINTVITKVVDGDTIGIEVDIGTQICRLAHIDAPERGEPYWREAKKYIEDHFLDEEVWITATSIDRYGRWIVEVEHPTKFILHYLMLQNGLAFHFTKYSKCQTCAVLTRQARNAGIGLWSIPNSFTKWRERIKEKEENEKKNENDCGNTPFLILIIEQYTDSDFDVDEIPGFMVDCRNFETQTFLAELKTPFATLRGY